MGRPLRVIKRTFIFLEVSLGLVSKKWSRVINARQVRREFIDIYCHSRYGRRAWVRSERSAWVERRESPTWASPSTRTCIARTILHACLPMYPARIRHCAAASTCERAFKPLPHSNTRTFFSTHERFESFSGTRSKRLFCAFRAEYRYDRSEYRYDRRKTLASLLLILHLTYI